MSYLQTLRDVLHQNASVQIFCIPARWQQHCANPAQGELDPYAFFDDAIGRLLSRECSHALEPHARVLYTLLPRFHTALAQRGALQGGTLLRTLALLPMLRGMGVNTLCLLPVFVPSERYRKGTLGSPYAIRDFFHIDPALHDPLLGEYSPEALELCFAALVEGAHRLGMQVVLDIVLRTAARDSTLIAQHPDWFYWIHHRAGDDFAPPDVPSLKPGTSVDEPNAHLLYTAPDSARYLASFAHDPRRTDPERFASLSEPELGQIEQAFSLTTAPAFCDVINDPQPLWSDVTYLRLDMGQNRIAAAHLPADHPPALLQDTVKLNLFPPGVPNEALYALLESVLPAWQQRFGIDGARLDMGHALPPELLTRIVARVRAANPRFFLWSEVFAPEDVPLAQRDGFDVVTGQLWDSIWTLDSPYFHKRVIDPLLEAPLPVIAALEMPDTPRAAHRLQDTRALANLWQFLVLLPNVMPLINDGQELLERQPMNLGLNNTEAGRFVLDPSDEAYGLLAFFDKTALHWNAKNDFIEPLTAALALRRRFAPLLADKRHFHMSQRAHRHHSLSAFGYSDGREVFLVMYLRCGKRTRFSLYTYFESAVLASCRNAVRWTPQRQCLGVLPRTCTLQAGELAVFSACLPPGMRLGLSSY